MSQPYSWLNPDYIENISTKDAIRHEFCRKFSRPGDLNLDPDRPMPVILGFTLIVTRPHPTRPGKIASIPRILIRAPGYIQMFTPQHLRSDAILDVFHATVRGRTHAIYAVSDAQLDDDLSETEHTRINIPPNPIGWALHKAAQQMDTECRHWNMKNGSKDWLNILRETKQAETDLGIPLGHCAQFVNNIATLTPAEFVDAVDYLEEIGFISNED